MDELHTWFASAYDTDDVAYRLLTFVQMAGALVLAAGVPRPAPGLAVLLMGLTVAVTVAVHVLVDRPPAEPAEPTGP